MSKYNYFNDSKYPIYVTEETLKVTPATFQSNGILWENDSMYQFFSKIDLNKNVNIIDVGAQSGLYTLFAKYLPNAHFYSFEPFKDTYNLLINNIKLNNLQDQVTTFNYGLSNEKGTSYLNVCKYHNGLHTMGQNPLRFNINHSDKIEIKTTTIDDEFYENNIKVDFIKIDTEGWEYNVLLGGIKTILRDRPIIQLEWTPENMKQCLVNENDLDSLMKDLNYCEKGFSGEEKIFFPL
jgi:FkbM family methyltransferase